MPIYRKQIVPQGPRDYDAILNGAYIGSFPSPQLAQAELDRVAFEDARRGGLLADQPFDAPPAQDLELADANPLVPFGVPGGPSPDLSGLTVSDLCRAAERIADYYERFPLVVRRVLSALDIAIEGLEDHLAGKAPADCKYSISEDGTLSVRKSQGSGRYLVIDDMCGCRSYWLSVKSAQFAGQGVDDGKCKHTLARELVRLAQAYRGTWNADGGNQLATLRVGARALARALKAAAKASAPIQVEVMFFRLRITAGGVVKVIETGTDGWGVRALTISAADAEQLARELWQASKAQPDAAVNLFLDEGMGEIDVFGADTWRFAAVVRQAC